MEIDKVKECLQYFFEGFDSLSTEMISKAFHPSAFLMESTPEGLVWISELD